MEVTILVFSYCFYLPPISDAHPSLHSSGGFVVYLFIVYFFNHTGFTEYFLMSKDSCSLWDRVKTGIDSIKIEAV